MKKLFLSIFFLLSFSFVFLEDFELLSWDTHAKEVLNYFIENNWSVSVDKDVGMYNFHPLKKIYLLS